MPTNMRRHRHILQPPELRVFRQGFRVCDIEGAAANFVFFQGADEVGGVDDGAAGDVGDEGAFFRQDAEFGGAYQVVGVIAVRV